MATAWLARFAIPHPKAVIADDRGRESSGGRQADRWWYYCLAVDVTASMTRSRLKLPGFWRGGNSLKLCSHLPT